MARKSKAPEPELVVAAGTVLYRADNESARPLIAVIHRPHRGDISLPKGKLEAGEVPPVAAFRETVEETGITPRLGRSLGTVSYEVPASGRHRKKRLVPKQVHYWAAERVSGEFVANNEVDRMEWVDIEEASRVLTYDTDREVLDRFAVESDRLDTLLLVRHARAGAKARWDGPDPQRPLDSVGVHQSRSLVALLGVFDGSTVHSADRVRCVDTVRPYADAIGVPIVIETSLSEEAYAADPERAFDRLIEIAAGEHVPVVCSQGKVIPFVITDWAQRDGISLPRNRSRKGSLWVMSMRHDAASKRPRLVAADYYDSPLPT